MSTLKAILEDCERLHTSLNLIGQRTLTAHEFPQLHAELQQARDAAQSIARYLAACKKRAAAPHDVLRKPELLERILIYFEPKMLLYITEIDLAFSSAVQQSKRLRQNSFLQADDKMFFTSLEKVDWIFDFPFTLTTYPNRRNGVETVPPSYRVCFEADTSREYTTPSSESRTLAMLVCQPPIYTVTGRAECPCLYPRSIAHRNMGKTIKSSTGITVRDILELRKELHVVSRMCDGARSGEEQDGSQSSDGANAEWGDYWFESNVTFDAPISLRDDDPILEPFNKEGERRARCAGRR